MGRQFRLYLIPSDIDRMILELRAGFDIKLIDTVSTGPTPAEIDSPISYPSPLRPEVISVHCYLAPPKGADIRVWYMPKRQLWAIDEERSEVIQFSGCSFDGKVLDCGRLYYHADMLVDDLIWAKRSNFVERQSDCFERRSKD